MADNNQIPETDKKLAEQVGTALKQERSVKSIEDPLIDLIADHKRNLFLRYENELSKSKSQSWNNISEGIQKGKTDTPVESSDKINLRHLHSYKPSLLKVAAALLIAILLSVAYLQLDSDQPELLARAESNQVTYTLGDQTRIQLRPHSRLFVVSQTDEAERYRLEGEAFFDVTKQENRRFLVDAGPGVIEVTGTSFNIREWTGETVVYLKDGSLTLNSSEKPGKVVLKPGEAATVNPDFEISRPVQTNGNEFTSWQQDEIVFNNRTVQSIIKELEYHYSIDIQVPDRLKNEILGGTLSLENKEVSLENLGIVLGGNFSSIEGETYQFVE
ncbi:MAG: FecR domain-containing protein [Balneolaceae bacterium]|nr:FecR domain-containing protein [Balneolaceae bacterium]